MTSSSYTKVRKPVRTVVDESGEQITIRVQPPGRSNERRKAIAEQLGR